MSHRKSIHPLLLGLLLAALAGPARALPNDIALFSTAGGGAGFADPNIAIVFDTSMTMRDAVGGPVNDPADLDEDKKWYIAREALLDFVRIANPPDGSGGYKQRARFGLWFYDKSNFGGRMVVPIEDDNTGDLIARMTTGWSVDDDTHSGTPMASTLVDIGRYYAGDTP